jgi:hypothetical protein
MVFITSVVIWLLETVKYWFVMHAFTLGRFRLMLMNGVVNLANHYSIRPRISRHIGSTRYRCTGRIQCRYEVATSYTFVLHLALWFPVTMLGLCSWHAGHKMVCDCGRSEEQHE